MSEEPCIPDSTTQEELEELGYLVERYQVFALEHQVVDRFNDRFHEDVVSGKWKVCADMVSRVYQRCGPASCLRQVFQAALKTVGPGRLLSEWEEWSRVADAGSDLGTDLLRAVAEIGNERVLDSRWGAKPSRFEDACRFHNHERQNFPIEMERKTGLFGMQRCPFRGVECFASGSTEDKTSGVGGVKGMKYKKGRRIRQLLGELRIEEALDDAPEAGDDDPKPVDDDLPAKEPEPEPEPELEPEPEQGPVADTAPELEQDSTPVYDEAVVEEEDCWGPRPKKEKEKKKRMEDLGWEEAPDSPVMVDRPADTGVAEEIHGDE